MLFHVILTNGTDYTLSADSVERNDGIYSFIEDGEVLAEFNGNRIAGYYVEELEDEED